ncbi:membrane protein [Polycladomyces abyssicola]|uniref:Membrane protein n=1 Tax=Polycladomyces abyssicola TaxID=1125966 RepID=A0A8D5UIK5_9BACL|nr:YwiC-like family protein [Polycladomyces abyssicola]BCU82748.1 membrane protein [Polycladomyces abyssicola]
MKWVIPHEHGGWVMLTAPFLLGTLLGQPRPEHLLLFSAWFFFYLASYAVTQWVKRKEKRYLVWGSAYWLIGFLSVLLPLWKEPVLWLFAPLFCTVYAINLYFVTRRRERAMLNDICAILGFAAGGVAAYVFGTGKWDATAFWLFFYTVLYFVGTVFFVKSVIRERKNPHWMKYAKLYSSLSVLMPLILGQAKLALVFIFPLIRLWIWGGKEITPKQAGIIEFANALQFVALTVVLMVM